MPVLRCGNKRYEFEVGWKNRLLLVAIPYFVIGFILNTLMMDFSWWGNGLETVIIIVNVLCFVTATSSILEVHFEPKTWYLAVFLTEVAALIASVSYLIIDFGHMKHLSHDEAAEYLSTTTTGPPVASNVSTNEFPKTDQSSSWENWKSVMGLILLSLMLIGNTTASRFIKIPSQKMPECNEECVELEVNQ